MPYPQNTHTPPKGLKIFLWTLGVFVGVGLLVFSSLFIYYAWQFKYGDADSIERISKEIQTQKFTVADGSKTQQTSTKKNISQFVRSYNPQTGNTSSKVTILAFIDFECPFCQAGYPVFKQIRQTYGPAARIVFKHMPLSSIHPRAMAAAHASQCAEEQGKFWSYYDILFTKKDLSDEGLLKAAEAVGLNTSLFTQCTASEKYTRQIQDDVVDGLDLGVRGTPTYFINQQILEGVADKSTWDTLILNELK